MSQVLSDAGYLQAVDTLTHVISGVIQQQNYNVKNLTDFVNFDFSGTLMDTLVRGRTRSHSNSRGEGFLNGSAGFAKAPNVTTSRDMYSIKNYYWLKTIMWTKHQLEQAAAGLVPFDTLAEDVAAIKKSWDLEIQNIIFAGLKLGEIDIAGILNIDGVASNTSLIPNGKTISSLSATEMYNFVATVLSAYAANSQINALPDRFVVPLADYLGWGNVFVANNGGTGGVNVNRSILEYLTDNFKTMTQNPDFKILPVKYAEAATMKEFVGEKVNRYALYQKEDEALKFHIPMQFRNSAIVQSGGSGFTMDCDGEVAGISCGRPENVFYIDSGVS